MEYLTVKESAKKWGLSIRAVQQLCEQGRIPGIQKFGKSWAIPAEAEKPEGVRSRNGENTGSQASSSQESLLIDTENLMPLMNSPFQPGHCLEAIAAMPTGLKRDIAMAEYYYFSGQAEKAVQQAKLFLDHEDQGAQLSACLIYAYANLSLGEIPRARLALRELDAALSSAVEKKPQFRTAAAFVASAAAVLLHLPLPDKMPEAKSFLGLLPLGTRAFAIYVQAHYLYLKEEYAVSVGMVEAALAMGMEKYPISAIYLHLIAVMDYMSLKQMERAKKHVLEAWRLARPDDLIEGLGEHHGLLGGMLEAVIKPEWPEDFKRIISITYRFSAGWRKVHNPITGHDVAGDLTTTEFAIAMLAARGWTNQEIANHLKISPNTVKRYLATAREKLHVSRRQDLKKYMLQ